MAPKSVAQVYTQENKWYQGASEDTIQAVEKALQSLTTGGACALTPPIMGGLLALGVLAKERTPAQAMGLLEALA